MSKTTSNSQNNGNLYSSATHSLNGQAKTSTHKIGSHVFSNYNMNPYEKSLYDYSQKTLSEIVPNVNVFSPEVQKQMQSQLDAYQKQGQRTINEMYTPMLNSLKNDMASRFGNIDNSMFLDKLSGIENARSNSVAQLAEDLILKRNDLINNELSNRYNYINLLNTLQNQYNSNIMDSGNYTANLLNRNNSSNSNSSSQSSKSNGISLNNLMSIVSLIGNMI
ncbi:hypothetical protein IJG72_08360 [bacterium]|nr:hypothetical protein [bacterium]